MEWKDHLGLRAGDYPIGFVHWTENRNMEAFVRLLVQQKLDLKPLITHRISIQVLFFVVFAGSFNRCLVTEVTCTVTVVICWDSKVRIALAACGHYGRDGMPGRISQTLGLCWPLLWSPYLPRRFRPLQSARSSGRPERSQPGFYYRYDQVCQHTQTDSTLASLRLRCRFGDLR